MSRIAALTALALAAACAPADQGVAPDTEAPDDAAAAAPEAAAPDGDLAWSFSEAAPGPRLAFGRPRTDDVRLMVRCADEPGRLGFRIMPPEQEPRPDAMTLRVGPGVRTVPVSVSESGLGGLIVEGTARIDESLRRNVRSRDPISAEWGGYRVSAPAPAGGQVDLLLEACA